MGPRLAGNTLASWMKEKAIRGAPPARHTKPGVTRNPSNTLELGKLIGGLGMLFRGLVKREEKVEL